MAETVTVNRERRAFYCYQCSSCGSPITAPFSIYTTIVQVQSWLGTVLISEQANRQFNAMMEKIRKCAETGTNINSFAKDPNSKIWPGDGKLETIDEYTDATTWIWLVKRHCPVCGHVETWMERQTPEALQLPVENPPIAFFEQDRALLWTLLKLQEQQEKIEARRKTPGAVMEAEAELQGVNARLTELSNDYSRQNRRSAYEALLSDSKKLAEEKAACKALNFKKKKELTRLEKEKQDQIAALLAEIKETDYVLLHEIALLECKRDMLLGIVNGPGNSFKTIFSKDAWASCLTCTEK